MKKINLKINKKKVVFLVLILIAVIVLAILLSNLFKGKDDVKFPLCLILLCPYKHLGLYS